MLILQEVLSFSHVALSYLPVIWPIFLLLGAIIFLESVIFLLFLLLMSLIFIPLIFLPKILFIFASPGYFLFLLFFWNFPKKRFFTALFNQISLSQVKSLHIRIRSIVDGLLKPFLILRTALKWNILQQFFCRKNLLEIVLSVFP